MIIVYFLAAVLIGVGQPVQASINAQLRSHLGDAAWATLVSVLVSAALIVLYVLVRRPPLPASATISHAPWWVWTGGVMGVIFVAAGLLVTPRLGASLTFSLVIFGQMGISLVLDHWGLIGLPVHHTGPLRILGVLLLLAGVALIRAF